MLLFQIEILQSYFFHRAQFLIETFDQALSLSLSLSASAHVLFGGHHQLLQFVVEVVIKEAWRQLNCSTRLDHLSLGEVGGYFCVRARVGCVVSVVLSVEPPRYDMRYDICQRRAAGWEGSLTRPTPAAHMGTSSQQETLSALRTLLSTLCSAGCRGEPWSSKCWHRVPCGCENLNGGIAAPES